MGFFKKLKKKVKKVARGVGNIAQAAAPFVGMIPGVGTVAAAALGAGGSLLSGDSLRTAIGSGIAGGLGGLAGGALGGGGLLGGLMGGAGPTGAASAGGAGGLGGLLGGLFGGGGGTPMGGGIGGGSTGSFGWADALFGGGAGGGSAGGLLGSILGGNGASAGGSNLGALGSLLSLGGDIYGGLQSGSSLQDASRTLQGSTQAGIGATNAALNDSRLLLTPYINAGAGAIGQQGNLTGINGADAQQAAISGLESSPIFQALLAQGNNSILQNASATGGLRGGNVQAALAQFSPQLLNQQIGEQFGRLGSIAGNGLNAAGTQAGYGLNAANNISELLNQQGAARAGGQIARGNSNNSLVNTIGQGLGAFAASGGLRGLFS